MSVLIKGLTVPKDSPVAVIINPSGAAFVDYGGARFETLEAVDVPAPHGRLIDADVFDRHMKRTPRYFSMCCDLEEQPTIIEAEKGTDI